MKHMVLSFLAAALGYAIGRLHGSYLWDRALRRVFNLEDSP